MKLRRLLRLALLIVALVVSGYAIWSRWDRRAPGGPVDVMLQSIASFGDDSGRGNLLGIQPYLVPTDYASADRFYRKLNGYFSAARENGFLRPNTIVVLPEYVGTWLVLAGEKRSVFRAASLEQAGTTIALSNLPSFLRYYAFAHGAQRDRYALLRMNAAAAAAIYQETFSKLAHTYRVTIVAGSLVLPSPEIREGRLVAGGGSLYNVSVLYDPDGQARSPLVKKVFLTNEERGFTRAGRAEDLPVFDTPAGRLGILICADSWYPEAYRALRGRKAELIAVPSYGLSHVGEDGFAQPWLGYEGKQPPDVDPADVKKLTEGQAWRKYALAGRLHESGARAGLNIFLRGHMWDLGTSGRATAVLGNRVFTRPSEEGASLVNLWLPPRPDRRF